MKKVFILLVTVFISTSANAQYMLDKGDKQVNAGLGFSSWGIPIYAGFDYGVHRDISVGGEISYRSYTERGIYGYHYSILGISVNGNYHFNTILKIPKIWDAYAGANIGFYSWSYPDNYYGSKVSGLGLGLQFGGRYYINDNFGLNIEFGGGNSFSGGKFGVSYKF